MKKNFNKLINAILANWESLLLLFFVLMASYLRFFNITKLNYFTYDQARDALYVKRMVFDHQWRLLGTQTSLPGMYLPPFYYYTIAPILWLFRLNPAGIDIYSAFIGVLTIPLIYYVANKIFGRPAGVFSAGLMAVSPLVVELTRRAWNPNTMPFFILVSFYFLYLFLKSWKGRDFLLAFGFYGYCLSLHFGAWTLMPLFILTWGYSLIKKKLSRRVLLGGLGLLFFFVCPLLIFEIKHNFFLSSQAKIFFFDGGHLGLSKGNFIEPIIASVMAIFLILISGRIWVGYGAPFDFTGKVKSLFALSQPISVVAQKPFSLSFQWWGLVISGLIVLTSFFLFRKRPRKENDKDSILALKILWIWIVWGVLTSRLYSGNFYFFYYLYLFPVPFLLYGFLSKFLWQSRKLKLIIILVLFLIARSHFRFTAALTEEWRDINDLIAVAKIISQNIDDQSLFNIATIQKEAYRWDRNSVDYRYFVESYGKKRALDWYPEDYQKANILFVISEGGQTEVLESKIMEIEEFSPGKIIGQWETNKGITVYKLAKKK